ncbi:MAG: hypothetical protein ACUVTG_09935, partial [Candidatus Oleimicrobiaceae bacterium]
VQGLPVAAQVRLAADGSYNLFVNGNFVAQVVQPAEKPLGVYIHEVSEFLQEGQNVVAVEARDVDGEIEGVNVLLSWRTIPEWQEARRRLTPIVLDEKERERLLQERERIP